MAEQVFGFVRSDCEDIRKFVRSSKQGNQRPADPSSHPWGGPPRSYLLLEALGPINNAAAIGGNTFSALALPLIPSKRPVQMIRRLSAGSFTLTYGATTTTALTGTSSAIQTALTAAGATCVVWGDGTTVVNDDGTTTTMAAGTWFVVFSEGGSTPSLITSSSQVLVSWSRLEPEDLTETVFLTHSIDPSLTMSAGTVVETVPLPDLGPAVIQQAQAVPNGVGSLVTTSGVCNCSGLCWSVTLAALTSSGSMTWPGGTFNLKPGGAYYGLSSLTSSLTAMKEMLSVNINVPGLGLGTYRMSVGLVPLGCVDPEASGRTLSRHTMFVSLESPSAYFESRWETCQQNCIGPFTFSLVRSKAVFSSSTSPDVSVNWPSTLTVTSAACHCGCFQECWFLAQNVSGTLTWIASTANKCSCANPASAPTVNGQIQTTPCPCDQNGCTGSYTYTAVSSGSTFVWSTPGSSPCSSGCSLPPSPPISPTNSAETFTVYCV